MPYVIQQPNSNTNPTNKYRVTDSADWMAYVNGAAKTYAYIERDDYQAAKTLRDELNADSK